jgi:hypothetical protein
MPVTNVRLWVGSALAFQITGLADILQVTNVVTGE